MSKRKRIERDLSGLWRPYQAEEGYRRTIEGNLKIDRDCWKKTEKEKELLKCLKANGNIKRII